MLYIKDYQKLDDLIPKGPARAPFCDLLDSLRNKAVTVFTDGTSAAGNRFSGVLTAVSATHIALAAALAPKPVTCNCPRCRNKQNRIFGTCVEIAIDHIAAIMYNYL